VWVIFDSTEYLSASSVSATIAVSNLHVSTHKSTGPGGARVRLRRELAPRWLHCSPFERMRLLRASFVAVILISALSRHITTHAQTAQTSQSGGFRLIPLPRDPAALRKEFTPAQLAVMEKLNRRDLAHLLRQEPPVPGLVVPLNWPAADDVTELSPLPYTFPWAEGYPKAIVVHQPWQVFGAYESGKLVRWGPVSSGRKDTPTPSGVFFLTWRSKGRYSTDNAAWFLAWYFNFINERGVSFHQFDLPGYAASHACVRLLERDAKWLYDWGGQWTLDNSKRNIVTNGTPVLIVGEYNHRGPAPWVDVTALGTRIVLTPPDSPMK